MKTLEKCQHCGEEKENCYHGYIAMCLPIPEAEEKIEKWNLIDAYSSFEKQCVKGTGKKMTQEEFNNFIGTNPEFSKQWFTNKWFNNLERTDLTDEEAKELDDLCSYDQFLNTVGRGIQCNDCGKLEAELYAKYYPEQYKSE
jgi:hypothetical protein